MQVHLVLQKLLEFQVLVKAKKRLSMKRPAPLDRAQQTVSHQSRLQLPWSRINPTFHVSLIRPVVTSSCGTSAPLPPVSSMASPPTSRGVSWISDAEGSSTWWTERAMVRRRGAGFQPGTFCILVSSLTTDHNILTSVEEHS